MLKSILVIDDELVILKSFKLALEDSGYDVDVAQSGEEGLEKLKSKKYDLLFLDLRMDDIDGIEVLKKLREHDKKLLVYVITAFKPEFFKELKSLKSKGIQFELLSKPITNDEILSVAKGVLG